MDLTVRENMSCGSVDGGLEREEKQKAGDQHKLIDRGGALVPNRRPRKHGPQPSQPAKHLALRASPSVVPPTLSSPRHPFFHSLLSSLFLFFSFFISLSLD